MKKEGKPDKTQTNIPIVFFKILLFNFFDIETWFVEYLIECIIIYIYWMKSSRYNKYYVLYLLFMLTWKLIRTQ